MPTETLPPLNRLQISKQINAVAVFLGLDHRLFGDGPPVLFETMIFPESEYQERCCT